MKRLLLYGFYGISNAGNEAMLKAFIEPIRRHYKGDVEFIVANRHPSKRYDEAYGVRSIQNLEHPTHANAVGRWLRGLNPDDSTALMKFAQEIAKSDLVVIGPGQYLVETGDHGLLKGGLAQLATVATICGLTSVPCYGLALACEQIESWWSKLVIQKVLFEFARLTFRDQRSVSNLTAAGIDVPPHDVLGDLALADEPAPTRLGNDVIKHEGIPEKSGSRLGVALRNIYWLGIDQNEFRERIARVLSTWLENHSERDVLMIPQNVYNIDGDRDDDRVANANVFAAMPASMQDRVHQVRGEYDPARIEALYGTCDVTLSTRLHGSVFSCKQGTPPVVLAFMDKTTGYFDRIGHPQCTLPLDASVVQIVDRLHHFVDSRTEISASITAAVDDVRQTAARYCEIAIELLEGTGRR